MRQLFTICSGPAHIRTAFRVEVARVAFSSRLSSNLHIFSPYLCSTQFLANSYLPISAPSHPTSDRYRTQAVARESAELESQPPLQRRCCRLRRTQTSRRRRRRCCLSDAMERPSVQSPCGCASTRLRKSFSQRRRRTQGTCVPLRRGIEEIRPRSIGYEGKPKFAD